MFIDREYEMSILKDIAGSDRAELVLLYGRRRVGKSSLLTRFVEEEGGVYFLADASRNILEILSSQVDGEFVNFTSWELFFDYILKSEHEIFVIDEFQYIYNTNRSWPTILQRWWEKIRKTNKKIILCGSIISTIDRIARGYGSALYGRKTREVVIEPLDISSSFEMLRGWNDRDRLKAYALVGGVPRYLEELDTQKSLNWNLEHRILDKTSYLYNEPMNLLFEEFRDPAPYVSILLSIINGMTRFSEISEYSHIESTRLSKYMTTLQRVKIIEKDIPITDRRERAKNTRYRLRDPFFRFWFGFVFPNKAFIEKGRIEQVMYSIRNEMDTYMGKSMEEICLELISKGMGPDWKVGRWWKKELKVDILAINKKERRALVGEVKWNFRRLTERAVSSLEEKVEQIDSIVGYEKELILISKEVENRDRLGNARVIDIMDLIPERTSILDG
ncbi:MAG: hypothetical protein DRN57_04620 [Thermoplasmata archaeon]|nr:MAG: hypothetical protein DRN57_04620 [Thermoplasmata archaeon]